MIKGLDYWYDAQQRRFIEQVVRAFSGFKYKTGWSEDDDGNRVPPREVMVPCTMASHDRQVAHILRNNSENTILTVPRITVWQSNLEFRRQDLQDPNFVGTLQVSERAYDPQTGTYGSTRGQSYTVHRLMALPFKMEIQVDIWTSTLDQKHQLSEQILVAVAPDFAIQNSTNAVDWSALTTMTLTNIQWSSRTIPIGTENEIDVMSLTFELPMWLSPPAKVTQQNVIEQVVVNTYDAYPNEDVADQDLMFQHITSPGNHQIEVRGNTITLLSAKGQPTRDDGTPFSWRDLIEKTYDKTVRPTISQVRLKHEQAQIDDWSYDLIGSIQYDPTAPNRLIWMLDPDTLPANTLPPVEGITNPVRRWPGNGLPPAARGQRYLLTHDIGGPTEAWGTLRAHENDIIEFDTSTREWKVLFSPVRGDPTAHYVLNLASSTQLRWTGEDWVLTIDGTYPAGYWRMTL